MKNYTKNASLTQLKLKRKSTISQIDSLKKQIFSKEGTERKKRDNKTN